jgi:hypothetical protein
LWRSLFDLFFSFIPLLMAMAETHLFRPSPLEVV